MSGFRDGTDGEAAIDGHFDPGFATVVEVFRRQLRRTNGGAALGVYHRGSLVVDVWGGHRTDDGDRWCADTLAMCFSTTKGVAAMGLHVLADRGALQYDAPVATYWPEFARNGKEGITVRHVLTHSAGLHRLGTLVDGAHRILDWEHMIEALENARPAYAPGTHAGYHGFTFGWLAGEIVRRVSGRPLDAFLRDEVVLPLGLDGLYLGCPPSERHRVATLEPMGIPRIPWGPLRRFERHVGSGLNRLVAMSRLPVNPRRIMNTLMPRGIEDVLWGADVMDASIPAANGFFTARSLARMYAVLAGHGTVDGVTLLTPETVEQIGVVHTSGLDRVVVMPMDWRLGYHRVLTTRGTPPHAFGHFGFGGSGAWADPSRELALAMVCNRGGGTPIGDLRILELTTAGIRAADRLAPAKR
ncbi:MAG: serine hydrolase domain-containing protein [Acidimicrobiia bacterium]